MKVNYKFHGKKKTVEMPAKSTVESLLLKINQNPEATLVKVDNKFIPEPSKLKNRKTYEVLNVGSQG